MNAKDKKKLAKALYNWREAYKALKTDQSVLDAQAALTDAKNALAEAEAEYRETMQKSEDIVKSLVPSVGQSVTAFGIRAKFTRPYTRVSFDSKVIDRIAQENVRFRNLVMPHRKETNVKERVNVEIAEPESLLQDIPFSPILEGVE